jgi:hypothetical protein
MNLNKNIQQTSSSKKKSGIPVCSTCKRESEEIMLELEDRYYCSYDCMQQQHSTYLETLTFDSAITNCRHCNQETECEREFEGELFCSFDCVMEHQERISSLEEKEVNLSICASCKQMSELNYELEGNYYCSDECMREDMILINQVSILCELTGLEPHEIKNTISINNWSLDDFIQNIDSYLDAISNGSFIPTATTIAFNNAGVYNTLSKRLSSHKTSLGGKNFFGTVFEELHATKATISGTKTTVLGDNGVVDFIIVKADGTKVLGQAKAGYQTSYFDFNKYKGQTMVVDKGNTKLINRAKSAGMEVIESEVSLKQSKRLSDFMKLESQILRTSNATLTSKIYALNQAGISSAKVGGAAGAGFSIGANIVDVFSGEKDIADAGVAVARDTLIATGSSYAIGAAASTTIGVKVVGTASTAGSALATTAVGSTVVTGATTLTGAATAATTAVTSAVASSAIGVGVAGATTAVTTAATGVATAVAGTVVGTAVTGAAATVAGTAVGAATIAGAAAVGAAAVAAAPIVAVAAVAGGAFTIGRKIFQKKY